MIDNDIASIAFSHNGDFAFYNDNHVPIPILHIHHAYWNNLLDANIDVQIKRRIMIEDVFIYTYTLFALSIVCVGTQTIMSTSIEHELTKRALESIIHVHMDTCQPLESVS
jgi:hypothetical protein